MALAWRIPWPLLAIVLIDLGALPAITIIGPQVYVMLTGMDLSTIEFAVATALCVIALMIPQLSRVVGSNR